MTTYAGDCIDSVKVEAHALSEQEIALRYAKDAAAYKAFEAWMDEHDPSWIHSNTASMTFNRAIWKAGYAYAKREVKANGSRIFTVSFG